MSSEKKNRIGVLITNTGTPDELSTAAIRRYLKEFLSDKRIIQLPRLVWLPILYGLILPLRPKRSLQLYKNIWHDNNSPIRSIMSRIAQKLEAYNDKDSEAIYHVEVGMNYGNPSIPNALATLQQRNVDTLIVLPLFPQYSNTTSASSYDRVIKTIKTWNIIPKLFFINQYADNKAYIATLANSVHAYWEKEGRKAHLLISFHGMPKRYIKAGDPYAHQCEATAQNLARALSLQKKEWTLCYQSQFGYDKWLTPKTQHLLTTLPQKGVKEVDVVCPGFAVDCLETLEEIAITGREMFITAGGNKLRYIPALNDHDTHITLLHDIVSRQL